VTTSEAQAFAKRLAEIGAGIVAEAKAQVVSGFWPIKDEPSTLPLLQALSLNFRAWRDGEPLIAAAMRIMEPPPEAKEVLPDLLFVPLAAFDRKGGRLGYGAGFYDRTLAKLRALKPIKAVGVAFEVQELQDLPQEPHDEPLDYVLTERKLIYCK
jgi:5-formyltetrahydrofolate cyclo-ligase